MHISRQFNKVGHDPSDRREHCHAAVLDFSFAQILDRNDFGNAQRIETFLSSRKIFEAYMDSNRVTINLP